MNEDIRKKYIKKFNKLDDLFLMGFLWNSSSHEYGQGTALNLTEAHTLQYIIENPDSNVTDISNNLLFSLSAASKIITRLEKKGLLTKEKHSDNRKNIYIKPTTLGLTVHAAHVHHDEQYYGKALEILLNYHSTEDLEIFFEVLNSYIEHHP